MTKAELQRCRREAAVIKRECAELSADIAELQDLLRRRQTRLHMLNAILKFGGNHPCLSVSSVPSVVKPKPTRHSQL